MSVDELKDAICILPSDELDRLSRWLDEFLADRSDRRIEADVQAGRFDSAGERADEDFEAGRCSSLNREPGGECPFASPR